MTVFKLKNQRIYFEGEDVSYVSKKPIKTNKN